MAAYTVGSRVSTMSIHGCKSALVTRVNPDGTALVEFRDAQPMAHGKRVKTAHIDQAGNVLAYDSEA